jgi:hypothetical protein
MTTMVYGMNLNIDLTHAPASVKTLKKGTDLLFYFSWPPPAAEFDRPVNLLVNVIQKPTTAGPPRVQICIAAASRTICVGADRTRFKATFP